MSPSRIVPAFLFVALAHAALIGVFLTSDPAPAPRRVQSAAIAARLLGPEPDQAFAALDRSTPKPSTAPARASAQAHAPMPSRVPPLQASPAALQPSRIARPTVPEPATPSQPTPPAVNAPNSPTPAAASRANANPTSAAQSAANETIAVAAPKHVEHADCRIAKPLYPELSKRRGEAGTTHVRFVIGTTGAIDGITLAKTSGFPRLDDAALQALRESTCKPVMENGLPIRASYMQAFTFGFDDE